MRSFFGKYAVVSAKTVCEGDYYSSLFTGEVVRVREVYDKGFLYDTLDGSEGTILFAGVKGVLFRETSDGSLETTAAGCLLTEEEVPIALHKAIAGVALWQGLDESGSE